MHQVVIAAGEVVNAVLGKASLDDQEEHPADSSYEYWLGQSH